MTDKPRLWMRHESRDGERRAPLTPADAGRLVDRGFPVVVEESDRRVFDIEDYRAVGCTVAPADTWPDAPDGTFVLGLKELPAGTTPLRDHIYFGHAFKGQDGSRGLIDRFVDGHGTLLDLEYLVDDDGRRLAAFGYWAGYVGAALAVLAHRGELTGPVTPTTREELDARLAAGTGPAPRALVVGALGRSGRGACDALVAAGIEPTRWDVEQTRDLDKAQMLAHDILVNTVMVTTPVPPFVTRADLDDPARRLSVLSDVTCDVTSDCNVLPVYDEVTTWAEPLRTLRDGERPVSIVAIDNLPTMLPAEASTTYSAELLPVLLELPDGAPWRRARKEFEHHVDIPTTG